MGEIGWHPSWKSCKDSDPQYWYECSDDYPYLTVNSNEWTNFYQEGILANETVFMTDQQYSRLVWQPTCPEGYYGNLVWGKCRDEWMQWTGSAMDDCTVWNFPNVFMFGKTCISECDTDLYYNDFSTYSWKPKLVYNSVIVSSNPECQTDQIYSKDNLNVVIEKYQSFSPSGDVESGHLTMKIVNKRGNITSTKFIQIEPTPDPNDPLTNLFPLIDGTTNKYVNETNTSTFNNYPEGSFFLIKAEITNDWGDKAIDYLSLAKEVFPTIDDVTITCTSTPWQVHEDIQIDLIGNWYNQNIDIFELYISVKIELPNGKVVVVQINKYQESSFKFTLPVVSISSNDNLSLNLLVTASNLHGLSTTLNKTLVVNNTLSSNFRDTLYDPSLNCSDLDSIAYLSAQMRATLNPLKKGIETSNFCIYDSDWTGNGQWTIKRNKRICNCDEGFLGVDWSISSEEFETLQQLVGKALDYSLQEINRNGLFSKENFDDLFWVINNLLIRPEFIEYSKIDSLIHLQSNLANKESVSLSLSDDFNESYFSSVSYVLTRLKYEYNVFISKGFFTQIPKDMEKYSKNIFKELNQKEKNLWLITERMLSLGIM